VTSRQVLSDATHWLVEMKTSENAEARRDEFEAWLAQTPTHRNAYDRVEKQWQDLDRLAAWLRPEKYTSCETFLAEVRKVSERTQRERADRDRRRVAARFAMGSVIAAGIALCFVLWLGMPPPLSWTDYQSADRPVPIMLSDGTLLYLNANSDVRVRLTLSHREVQLDKGDVFFRVHHDPERPFEVAADGTRVRAIGTEFWVKRGADGEVDAAVTEGRVEIGPAGISRNRNDTQKYLAAGQTANVKANEVLVKKSSVAEITRHLSWAETHLYLDGTLAQAVAEFNLHNERQLIIEDAALEVVKVAGVFDWSQPEEFAESLQDQGISYRLIPADEAGRARIALSASR
jgi:transmembrane sensor